MGQDAVAVLGPTFRTRANVVTRSVFITAAIVLVLMIALSKQSLHAQSACAQLGVDCSHHSSSMPSIPSTQQIMQQQVASTVVNAFVNMLFSNDSQANAQKQKMLAELQQRQAEAARQQQITEAARLAAICQRLQGTLKLSGTPQLKLKSDAPGGLQLKLGDPNAGHVGVPGLPGIALNDNTGNGGSTPYGIAGLPGIYTNGPATHPTASSGDAQSPTGGLKLKMSGEDSGTTQIAQTAPAAEPIAIPDPRTMSPQQLADLAQNLTPEQQQQLANALQQAQTGGVNPNATGNFTPNFSPATAPTTTNALTSQPQATAQALTSAVQQPQPSSAFGQLQGTAAASQKAALAQTSEGAAAGAREGFDTAAGGVSSNASIGARGQSPAQNAVPVSNSNSPSTGSSSGGTQKGSGQTYSAFFGSGNSGNPVVDISVLKSPSPIANAPARSSAEPKPNPDCVQPTQHKLPTRHELLTELAKRRTELAQLRQTITRLNRSIQTDQKQFAEWQAEAEAGYDRVVNRVLSLPTKLAMDTFIEMYEEKFARAENMKVLTDKGRKQLSMLNRAKELKSFDDFQRWLLEEKPEIETYDEGLRQLISALPVSNEIKSYANCAEDLIDNAYDYVDLVNTWQIVNQLDRNSDRYLAGVQANGQRMKALTTRIQEIEKQLNAVSPQVQIPYCSR